MVAVGRIGEISLAAASRPRRGSRLLRPPPMRRLLQQRGDGGIGLHDFGYAAYGEVGGVGGVFVAFFAAEETPAAVVFEYRLFAVEEPYRIALVIHGAGGDAAVERVGEGLGKSVHVGCSQNKDGFYTIRLFSALSRHRGAVL